MSQVAHKAGAYPGFCSVKRIRAFLLPPGWDASPSQGYPSTLNLPVAIYTPDRVERVNTTQCSQPEPEPRLLKIEKKYKNQITGCLHRQLINFKMDNN